MFEQTETKTEKKGALDVSSLKSSKVRGMFHAVGRGSNGWYFDDPALKMDWSSQDLDQCLAVEDCAEI